jgi:NAD(P)H dehydrogenase (quinone)
MQRRTPDGVAVSQAVVVHCHPLDSSFTGALRDRAVAALAHASGDPFVVELGEHPEQPNLPPSTETLVLVYPTWWSGQPAVLTQWLADALPQLGSVRRLVAVTSHGSPKRVNLLEGENGKRLLRKVVLAKCAPRARFEWVAFYNIDAAPDSKRRAFLDRVEQHLTKAV